jgi:hypothetical protein
MVEYCRLGRPIVIWGPEYSTAMLWGRESGAALCVHSERPEDFMKALEKLAGDLELRQSLARNARQAYETQFHPDLLQEIFEKSLRNAIAKKNIYQLPSQSGENLKAN